MELIFSDHLFTLPPVNGPSFLNLFINLGTDCFSQITIFRFCALASGVLEIAWSLGWPSNGLKAQVVALPTVVGRLRKGGIVN
jgi:hypothetical protein